jgi:hypothetical protein
VSDNAEFSVVVESASQLPLFLTLLLDLVSKSLSPALLSQWFFVDVIRKVLGTATAVLRFCLSSSCTTTSAKRARSLEQLVKSATALLALSSGSEDTIENLFTCLLRHRLIQGPHASWEALDLVLRTAFEKPLICPPTKGAVAFILDALRKENWENGGGLRVSPFIF